jgi:hypothetical protein
VTGREQSKLKIGETDESGVALLTAESRAKVKIISVDLLIYLFFL